MIHLNRKFFLLLVTIICYTPIHAQLEYVPPILGEIRDPGLKGVVILNTSDYHYQHSAPALYPSTLQVIDPLHPWPPVFFVNAQPGGEGLLGRGYFTNFSYHPVNGMLSFYTTITLGKNPTGAFLISDRNFKVIDTIGGHGFNPDSHDLQINSRGERLYMIVVDTVLNLSSVSGNPSDTAVLVTSQAIVIDDKQGKRIFYWDPLDHLPVTESYKKVHDLRDNNAFIKGWDWQHANSAVFTFDGNIAYSFRFLGVGKINRQTGEIMWKLGGKNPTIPVPKGGEYFMQHDFKEIAPGIYSLFSNGGKGKFPCKGIVYRIDEKKSTAQLIRQYEPAPPVLSRSLGNYQILENGLSLVNYGKYASLAPRQPMFEIVDTTGVVRAEYTSPSLNFAYRVQYVQQWKPIQPVLLENNGMLEVSGNCYSNIWYRLSGNNLVRVSDQLKCKPEQPGTYLAITRAGFGWLVSKTYVVD